MHNIYSLSDFEAILSVLIKLKNQPNFRITYHGICGNVREHLERETESVKQFPLDYFCYKYNSCYPVERLLAKRKLNYSPHVLQENKWEERSNHLKVRLELLDELISYVKNQIKREKRKLWIKKKFHTFINLMKI